MIAASHGSMMEPAGTIGDHVYLICKHCLRPYVCFKPNLIGLWVFHYYIFFYSYIFLNIIKNIYLFIFVFYNYIAPLTCLLNLLLFIFLKLLFCRYVYKFYH